MAERRIDIVVRMSGTAGRDAAELERRITDAFRDIGADVHVAAEQVDDFGDRGKRGMERFGAGTVAAGNLIADFVKGGLRQLQQFGQDVFEQTLDYRKVRATVQNLGADIGAIEDNLKTFDAAWGDQTTLMSTYFQLHSGGITDTSEALEALRGTAKLAFGEAAEMSTVAAAGIKAVNVYGGQFTDTLEQISVMAKLGDTNLEMLASSLPTVLETAKGLDISLADVGGNVSVLTQKFRSAQQATMYLDAMIRSFSMGSDQAAAAAKTLNIEWSASALQARGLTGYVQYLAEAVERSGKGKGEIAELLQKLTGSAEASRAVRALVGSVEELPPALEAVATASGRIEEVEQNMEAAIGPAERLKNAWANMQIQLGEELAPAVAEIIELFNEMLPTILNLAKGVTTAISDIFRLFKEVGTVFDEITRSWDSLPEPMKLILATPGAVADLAGKAIEGSASTGVAGAVLGRAEFFAEHMSKIYRDLNVKLGSGGITGQSTAQLGDVFVAAAQGAEELTGAVAKLGGAESELTKEQLALLETFGGLDYKVGLVTAKYDELERQARAMGASAELMNNLRLAEIEEVSKLVEANNKLLESQDGLVRGGMGDYIGYLISQWEHWLGSTENLNQEMRLNGLQLGIVDEQIDTLEDSVAGLDDAEQRLREHLEETNISIGDMVAVLDQLAGSLQIAGALASSFGFGDISKYFAGLQGMQRGFELWSTGGERGGLVGGWMQANAIAGIAGSVISTVAALWKAFSGPTNEELAASAAAQLGERFGISFSDAAIKEIAERLPRALSGKIDVDFAAVSPEALQQVLDQLDSFGQAIQAKLAESAAHGVNMMMAKLGLTHAQAFEMMSPVFEGAIEKALESGELLHQTFLNLIEHARNLGVEIEVPIEKFTEALLELLEAEELDIEALERLGLLAEQLGVSLDDAFSAAKDRVIELRREWRAFGEEIEAAARRVEDAIIKRWQWAHWTLPAAGQAMERWVAEQGEKFAYTRWLVSEGPSTGGPGAVTTERQDLIGLEAWEALQADLREMTEGWTELLTAAEYEEIMGRLGSVEAQQRVGEWYEIRAQGIVMGQQLEEARRTVRLLERAQADAREDWRVANRRLQDAKESLNALDRVVPTKLTIIHQDLRDVLAAIRNIPGRQSGGYIPDTGLYQLHRGEYVLPAGGVRAGESAGGGGVVHHTPIVINLEGGGTRTGTVVSRGEIVEILWDELEHGDREIPAHRVEGN